jgi:hypothetical protein
MLHLRREVVFVSIWYFQGFFLEIRGFNKLYLFTWYSDNIDDVDEIIIKIVDVTYNSEPVNIISTDFDLKPDLEKRFKIL